MSAPRATIGLICDPDHEVFSVVAQRLEAAGLTVRRFDPGRRLATSDLDSLDLLVTKKLGPETFHALVLAAEQGLGTWNGLSTAVLGIRPIGLLALQAVGFSVPPTAFEKPAGDYVAKPLYDWRSSGRVERNGTGDLYQELVDADPLDQKYYAVDDGSQVHVRVVQATSKLRGEKRVLGQVEPDPEIAAGLRTLMAKTDSQALGIDVLETEDGSQVVDVNPAMSFRETGLESAIVDSIRHRLESGPVESSIPDPAAVGETVKSLLDGPDVQ